ncbi:MAG: RsmE family RNA methyltransferase [Acidobacteriaceae bacterium]
MTRRRWIADEWSESSAVLRDAQAAHLARVLRAQVGQEFDIVAGDAVRRGVVEQVQTDAVYFSLYEDLEAAATLPLTIVLAIIRFERMEWAIEKLTELGVSRIAPLCAARSEKHLVQAAMKRAGRWRRIAREAAQQSRRDDVPEIADPSALSDWVAAEPDCLRLSLSEHRRVTSLRTWMGTTLASKQASPILAAIGPEGGWTEKELASFAANGWQPVSLGPRILRAETAAIALTSALSAWLGS